MGSLKAVYQWVLRTMMKSKGETGIVQTMPKKDLVELNTQVTAQRLMQNGIDPTTLKNADQVENVIRRLESRPTTEGVASTKTAKIMDMKGKEIDPKSKIMGGKQAETDAEIKARLDKGNKEGLARIKESQARERQRMIDRSIDNASPGFSGDRKVDAELVAELMADNMGKVYDDLPTKERLDLYAEAFDALSKKRFEDFAQGGRAGFFMGGANPKGLALLRQILNYMSKKGKETGGFKGIDVSGLDMLRLSNPKRFNKLLEDVRGKVNIKEGIMGTDTVRVQQEALREKRKGITAAALDVAKDMKAKDDAIAKRIAEESERTIIPQVKKQLMEGMGMSEEAAEKAARGMAEAAQKMRPLDAPPEITEEGILQLENVLKNMETGGKKARELNADGGRIGFKDGMSRRTFLKIFSGLVSLPIIGKVFAPLKLTKRVKNVPIIKTDDVPGKPEWFDQLVNKVIIEGDDVTKKFATKEREIVHAKQIDEDNYVTVTQDLDEGVVRVEYENPKATMFGDKVDLTYKKPLPDEGDPSPVGEFQTAESGIVGRAQGPDDYDLEIEGMSGRSIEDLESDVSALKQYATGKKPTLKEIVQNKKRRDKVEYYETPEGQSEYVAERQGEYDGPYEDDFASGGIAGLLGE